MFPWIEEKISNEHKKVIGERGEVNPCQVTHGYFREKKLIYINIYVSYQNPGKNFCIYTQNYSKIYMESQRKQNR